MSDKIQIREKIIANVIDNVFHKREYILTLKLDLIYFIVKLKHILMILSSLSIFHCGVHPLLQVYCILLHSNG